MLVRSKLLRLMRCAALFTLTQTSLAGSAAFSHEEFTLYGELTQGGMIRGELNTIQKPDSQPMNQQIKSLLVLKREVFIDQKGHFVFGLGRDTPETIELTLTKQSGEQQFISIPVRQREYNIQRIEGVANKYVRELDPVLRKRTKEEAAQVWRARQSIRAEAEFQAGFNWPAEGPITGVYGSQRVFNGVPKRPHYGLDIAGPVGTPVYAPAAGEVTLAHNEMYYSGGTLIVDHGQGISSTFIHLNKIHVVPGQMVKSGERIADMGATGRVTGPHLDWHINWFDQRLDPALVLPSRSEVGSTLQKAQE